MEEQVDKRIRWLKLLCMKTGPNSLLFEHPRMSHRRRSTFPAVQVVLAVAATIGLPAVVFAQTLPVQLPGAASGPSVAGVPSITGVPSIAVTSPGYPYGVAAIELPMQTPILGDGLPPLEVVENERVRFVISENLQQRVGRRPSEQPLPPVGRGRLLGRVGNLIREISGANDETETYARRVMFLFEGEAPLEIQLTDRGIDRGTYSLTPLRVPDLHGQWLDRWWAEFTKQSKRQIESTDTPPWIQTYLVAMLSSRLSLPLPDWYGQGDKGPEEDPLLMTLQWIGGAAKVSNAVFAAAAIGSDPDLSVAEAAANVTAMPVPAAIDWHMNPQSGLPEDAPEPAVEPLAHCVPPECFYIRYGNFENYLWFQDLTDEYGGDVSRMITLSGLSNDGAARLLRQLGIQMTAMGRVLGPTIIVDQALIGRDLFLQDGAAMGVVFESNNAFLLRTSLNNDRQTLASSSDAITLKTVDLEHGQASLLRSTDNAVRSFLVEHDGFLCVTNSRFIADRFLEVGQTGDSLAKTDAFRSARHWMPLERNDTIFAYFSPGMLQGLLSPHYLIELRRRMQSEADIALVHLARLAAASMASSNQPALEEIQDLVNAGFLPVNFGRRADGSGVVTVGDRVLDTRRGARGTFLPIPDSQIDSVTVSESRWYDEIAAAYQQQFRSFDPIFVGVQREAVESFERPDGTMERRERLAIHAEIAPWQPENYGSWAEQLGPPTRVAMQFSPDDIVAVQAHVASDQLGPPTHLFAAIKDSTPPRPESFDGILNGYRALKTLPGYLGAYPQPGVLDRLPLGLGRGQPVGPGMSRLIGGVYRFTGGGFSVLSFQHDLLAATLPVLAATEVDDSVQVRAHVGNLDGSQLEGYVNELLYERAAKASAAGAEFLQLLNSQLGVKADTVSPETARILGGSMQCPLGGQYELSARNQWFSTAWGAASQEPTPLSPPGYQAPILQWFRGLDATLTQYPNRLIADIDVEVARHN